MIDASDRCMAVGTAAYIAESDVIECPEHPVMPDTVASGREPQPQKSRAAKSGVRYAENEELDAFMQPDASGELSPAPMRQNSRFAEVFIPVEGACTEFSGISTTHCIHAVNVLAHRHHKEAFCLQNANNKPLATMLVRPCLKMAMKKRRWHSILPWVIPSVLETRPTFSLRLSAPLL